jgi:DNA-binding XRE family transcriptional regulator
MPDSRDAGTGWARWLDAEIRRTRMPKSRLAARLGINRTTVYNWLNGETKGITVAMAERVAEALGADRDEAIAAAGQHEQASSVTASRSAASPPGGVPDNFGPWLTRARQRAGHATSAALADAARFTSEDVYAWEHGVSRPEIWECLALARVLNIRDVDILAAAGWIELNLVVLELQRRVEERGVDDPDVAAALRVVRMIQDQD